jgi:hypothetical protein
MHQTSPGSTCLRVWGMVSENLDKRDSPRRTEIGCDRHIISVSVVAVLTFHLSLDTLHAGYVVSLLRYG